MRLAVKFKEIECRFRCNFGEVYEVGGGSITVDQEYSPESENAQSGKAVAQVIEQTKTDYKAADKALENRIDDAEKTIENDCLKKFESTHSSDRAFVQLGNSETIEPIIISKYIYLGAPSIPMRDKTSHNFDIGSPTQPNHAVSRKYMENAIAAAVGDIETALDGIIAIQESLLGGAE